MAADGHSRAAVGVASDLGDAAVASQPAALVGGAALAFAGLTRRPARGARDRRRGRVRAARPARPSARTDAADGERRRLELAAWLAAAAGLDDDAPPPREARP